LNIFDRYVLCRFQKKNHILRLIQQIIPNSLEVKKKRSDTPHQLQRRNNDSAQYDLDVGPTLQANSAKLEQLDSIESAVKKILD